MGYRYDNGERFSVRRDHTVEEERRVIDLARSIADIHRSLLRIKQDFLLIKQDLLRIKQSFLRIDLRIEQAIARAQEMGREPRNQQDNRDREEPLDQAFFDSL